VVKQTNRRRLEKLQAGTVSAPEHVVFFTCAGDKAAAADLARLRAEGVPETEIQIVRWLDSYDPEEDRAIWEAAQERKLPAQL
jgi:hypothetical protein